MPTKTTSKKVECLNPNTGGRMNIDKGIYDLFSKAIYQTLKKIQPLTYTQIVECIHDYLKQQKTKFDGSVEWYAITIKNDMHARGIIEVFTEKGKKLHRLKN
jgi:sulfur transfer complex TusBCD TusB component (DsrH family)